MTQNTTDDAAARLAARGEPVTLKAVLKEQAIYAAQRTREKNKVPVVQINESDASMAKSYDIFRRIGKLKT